VLTDSSDVKTTKTDEPVDVTVDDVGVVQYWPEPIVGDDVVAPL